MVGAGSVPHQEQPRTHPVFSIIFLSLHWPERAKVQQYQGGLVESFLKPVEKALQFVVSMLIGLMMVWVFIQVITRYVFNYTPSYGEELARYMFVWVVFLSLPVVAKKGGHMAIEMVTVRLKGTPLKIVRICAEIFTMAFLAIMVIEGTNMVLRASFQTSAALQISMSWVYSVIPFGCLIMFLNVLESFIRLLRTPASELKGELPS